MEVKGSLNEASLQTTDTAGEAALRKQTGMVYYNYETGELLIGEAGTSFKRVKVAEQHALGDVRASFLTEAQFTAEVDGTWTLCDGKLVTGSDYEALTGNSSVPDLRGMFLRGKNNGRADGDENPAGDKDLGIFETDNVGLVFNKRFDGIGVSIPTQNQVIVADTGVQLPNENIGTGDGAFQENGFNVTKQTSGRDVAPKNVTVNYFIKINR